MFARKPRMTISTGIPFGRGTTSVLPVAVIEVAFKILVSEDAGRHRIGLRATENQVVAMSGDLGVKDLALGPAAAALLLRDAERNQQDHDSGDSSIRAYLARRAPAPSRSFLRSWRCRK